VAVAVLSGNRNFEGRIHPLVRANYLASPPLVVAYALAGRMDLDLTTEPLGIGTDGKPVFLRESGPRRRRLNPRFALPSPARNIARSTLRSTKATRTGSPCKFR